MKLFSKLFIVAIFVFIFCVVSTTSIIPKVIAEITDDLSAIDSRGHSPKDFDRILSEIKSYYPQLSKQKIGDYIAYAFDKIRKKKSYVTIYEVAQDILSMAQDGSRSMDLPTLVGTHVFLETQ